MCATTAPSSPRSSSAKDRNGALRRSVGDPGFSSSRPSLSSQHRQVRVAEDDDAAAGKPRPQPRAASRLGPRVVHHPDLSSGELDDPPLGEPRDERVAVPAYRVDRRVGAELEQDLGVGQIAAVQDRVRALGLLRAAPRGASWRRAAPTCVSDVTRTRTATPPPAAAQSHRVGEPQCRHDLGDVVQPHDVGASVGAQHRGRERAPQVALVEPGRVRRELLVRARCEQRCSERAQTRQRRDQREVARGVLAEPEARVEQERRLRDPGREGLLPSRAQLGLDVVDRTA